MALDHHLIGCVSLFRAWLAIVYCSAITLLSMRRLSSTAASVEETTRARISIGAVFTSISNPFLLFPGPVAS